MADQAVTAHLPDSCACVLKCSTHEAAGELLEALKEVADRLAIHIEHTEDLIAHMKAHKAIQHAEGK